jgi:hypothetical protein
MPSASARLFIDSAVPIVLQWPIDGDAFVVDVAGGQPVARMPDDGAGADPFAFVPAVQHRPARQNDGRQVHRGGGHQAGGRGLVAAGRQHNAVEREAVQDLDQTEVGEIAVERGGRAAALFGKRVNRKLHRDAARVAYASLHTLRQFQVVPIARRQVVTRLCNADDRPTRLQLFARQAVVHEAFDVEGGHVCMARIVEPKLAAQSAWRLGGHGVSVVMWNGVPSVGNRRGGFRKR